MKECHYNKYIFNNRIALCKDFDNDRTIRGISPYEVFKIIEGIPLFLEDHIDRLKNSIVSKNLEFCFEDDQIKKNIDELQKINNVYNGNIKLLVNYFGSEVNCFLFFVRHKYPTPDEYSNGVPLSFFQGVRENPNVKLINSDLNNAAVKEKSSKKVYEILLVDDNGNITEGSMSNVFFIQGSGIYTPPLKSVLPGITRKYVISVCGNNGIRVNEKEIHISEMESFDAVFITGTSSNVLPVSGIERLTFDPHDNILRFIMQEFDKVIETYLRKFKI